MSSDPLHDSSRSAKAQFATTHWSIVLDAGHESSPDCETALASLCETYWYPLYAYARRRGSSPDDAKDLTQGFFARLLEKKSLHSADQTRGRFRSFLLTIFKRFMASEHDRSQAQKRGGGVTKLSIDFESGEDRYRFEPSDSTTPEKIYERRWALTLLGRVMSELEQEYAEKGKSHLFDHCRAHLTQSAESYAEAAEALEMSPGAVRVAVHRMRRRYRELLQVEVAQTVANPDEIDDELNELRAALQQ